MTELIYLTDDKGNKLNFAYGKDTFCLGNAQGHLYHLSTQRCTGCGDRLRQ